MKILRLFKDYFFGMKRINYDKFLVFAFMWVWLVSMLDHYITIKMNDTILEDEQNPLGTFLINIDSGSVALFMTVKMICLWVIAGIILSIYQENKTRAYICIVALCIAQLFLLLYFMWGHHLL